MSQRKYFFLPPLLCLNELNVVLTGERSTSKLTANACLLYTLLCQDLIRLRLAGDPDGYTQVHSNTLQTIFDDNYAKVIKLLLASSLLEVLQVDPLTGEYHPDGYYSKTDKTARAYRIPAHLRTADQLFKHSPINAAHAKPNPVLAKKIDRLNRVTTDPTVLADYHRQLVMANMRQLVLVDNAETRALIAGWAARKNVVYDEALSSALIAKFNDSPIGEPSVDAFAGRVQGKVVTLIKLLRAQQRYRDELSSALVEFDLVASQPWFLSIVSPALIKKFVPECADAIPFFKAAAKEEDVVRFRKLCGNAEPGQGIYDELAKQWNARYQDTFTRDQAKAICYRAFFSDYERKEKTNIAQRERSVTYWSKRVAKAQRAADVATLLGIASDVKVTATVLNEQKTKLKRAVSKLFTQKCYELFKDKFPGMYELFRQIKTLRWDFPRGQKPGETKTKYYANNALLAQRLEANIVFGVVVKALADAKITKVHTIHDAFVVREQDAPKARKVILKAFKSIGLRPNLKQLLPNGKA
jgi:hypothetical protein